VRQLVIKVLNISPYLSTVIKNNFVERYWSVTTFQHLYWGGLRFSARLRN